MKIKKIISGIVLNIFLFNFAIADSGTNYKVDISEINAGGTMSSSANYKTNSALIGSIDGNMGYSANFTLGSGLPYLELLCGNGILEFGEECDDGNLINGDGCSSLCKIETAGAVCGNGILEPGEQCDDGNLIDGDGCSSVCTIETGGGGGGGYSTPYSYHVCGNGILQGAEECDDGNTVSGDGCSSTCKIETIPPGVPEDELDIPEGLRPAPEEEKIIRDITIIAKPEKRVNAPNNWGTQAKLVFYNKTIQKTSLILTIETNNSGWGFFTTDRLRDGVYDISLKGRSHLTKVLREITIDKTTHTIDFSLGGSYFLIAGDVHESKDDFINGLDIAATVNAIYSASLDADLNRDGIVNGLDLSIVVGNIYKRGEKIKT